MKKSLLFTLSLFLATGILLADTPAPSPSSMKQNHLANEKSPYLKQHADNPVDWHPWGEEALAKAKEQDKPIFVSIGYSTCHWCHVMNRESFSNPDTAAFLNQHFIAIKVDREERPDIDQIYMTFVQSTTGHGGWPLNVFLTPDLEPFFGGTYFPPENQQGQLGFPSLIQKLAELWKNDRMKIVDHGKTIRERLQQFSVSETSETAELSSLPWQTAYQNLSDAFDAEFGGFGGSPKFPQPSNLSFLLRFHVNQIGNENQKNKALRMVSQTLHKMQDGGIHDPLAGGFHRYAVDQEWRVPHFEKMLYDQALLTVAYLETFQATKDQTLLTTANRTLDYVLNHLTSPDGGFYSAEDAESLPHKEAKTKEEGSYYIWTAEKIKETLNDGDYDIFAQAYGVEENGNVSFQNDPRGELKNQNVLYQKSSTDQLAQKFESRESEIRSSLDRSLRSLHEARQQRPHPHLDDKIIAEWNGLMISAFAKAYQVTNKEHYLKSAIKAAIFLKTKMTDSKNGHLLRIYLDGPGETEAFCADYANVINGLLDLYEASFEIKWLQWAVELQETQDKLFFESEQNTYFNTAEGQADIIVRMRSSHDGATPSENSISALNLARLAALTGRTELADQAKRVVLSFQDTLESHPQSMSQLLLATDFLLNKPKQIIIASEKEDPALSSFIQAIHQRFLPRKVIMLADSAEGQKYLSQDNPFIAEIKPIDQKPTAFVCEDFVCKLPTNDLDTFQEQL
jgi:uncharacterized protein YyaL (SSP411 family)